MFKPTIGYKTVVIIIICGVKVMIIPSPMSQIKCLAKDIMASFGNTRDRCGADARQFAMRDARWIVQKFAK